MKIRIENNSIRLRLTQPEVAQIINGQAVEAQTYIGNNTFKYSLNPTEIEGISAFLFNNSLRINMSMSWAKQWADESKVGFNYSISTPKGELFILVEKDFQCLAPERKAQETEQFKNPLEGKVNC